MNHYTTSHILTLVEEASAFNRAKSKALGEVFTPYSLINDMLDQLPADVWTDSTKTWFDPCAGKGNFPAAIVARLMEGLAEEFPNEEERYKHIVEKQLYMSEYQPESAEVIERIFNPAGKYQLNLHVGDTLSMPADYFDAQ